MTLPVPVPTLLSRTYWQAAAEGKLLLQRCDGCKTHLFYPRGVCPKCFGLSLAWVEARGTGTVESFTVIRQAPYESYAGRVPYVVALVRLDEGVVMMANLVTDAIEEVCIRQPVAVVFEKRAGAVVPQFKPV